MHRQRLRAHWLESSFAEAAQGVLVNTKLTMRHQCATSVCLGPYQREYFQQIWGCDPVPPLSTDEALPGVLGAVLGSPVQE